MKRFACVAVLAVLGAAIAGAAPAGLWVQSWSYDMPGEAEYYESLATAFASQPGGAPVSIELGSWDVAHDQIGEWLKTGTGPDLVVVPDIWLVEYAQYIEPFDRYVSPDLKGSFFDVLYNKGIYNGDLLGLVWATSSKALFYRKDLFRAAGIAPPRTWAEQLAAAKALNDPPNVYGIGLPGAREYETDDNFFFYMWSAGGEFLDAQGKCTINSEAGVKALQFYCDLANKHHVTQPELTTWNRKKTRGLLEAGRLAMFATGPWGVEQMRKNAPGVEFGVVPLPVDKEPVTQIITDHLVLAKHSKRKELAARFVQFAYTDANRLAFAKLGILPEKEKVAANPYFQNDPEWKVFIDVIPGGRTIPLIEWENVGITIREAMYQALSGRKTPQQALDDAAREINALVAKQGASGE
jgi:multiple sugar transport system substrate-binding protein